MCKFYTLIQLLINLTTNDLKTDKPFFHFFNQ